MNYLTSLWIANFGVVPWLLFAFFLFLPIFFFLMFLLQVVCVVFEAMIYPFFKNTYLKFQCEYLSIYRSYVKMFLLISMIYPMIVEASTRNLEEIYLAKGEQTEIKLDSLASFSIGNKEVLHTKFYASEFKILIKGNSIGFSDLVTWTKKGKKTTYNVYVVPKKEQLRFSQIASDFKNLGLTTQIMNNKIILNGSISTTKNLVLYRKFKELYKKFIITFVELDSGFIREEITKVYTDLGPESSMIECTKKEDLLACNVSPYTNRAEYINKYPHIQFSSFPNNYSEKNFEVVISIYKLNFTKGSQNSLGAYQAGSTVLELSSDPKNLVNNNIFKLSSGQAKSQLLATPKFVTSVGSKQSIQLGSEIPYSTLSQGQSNTDWIFAGLKIDTLLEVVNEKLKLIQKTEVTNPSKENIQGGKSSSQVFISPNKEQLLFDINYDTLINQVDAFPILGSIPILRKIFVNEEEYSSQTHLIAFITVKDL